MDQWVVDNGTWLASLAAVLLWEVYRGRQNGLDIERLRGQVKDLETKIDRALATHRDETYREFDQVRQFARDIQARTDAILLAVRGKG